MTRPKSAVGEVVDVVGLESGYAGTGEIISKIYLEDIDSDASQSGKYSGWVYTVIGDSWTEECLRKRPDLREPFSIESLKKIGIPEGEPA